MTPRDVSELPLHVVEVLPNGPPHGPDAPSFLFLHGFAGSLFTWHSWTSRLAERGRVVLVDLKGFGDAPKPDDGRYTPADQAAAVLELIESMDLRRLTLVGHSLGGGIALLTALRLLDAGSDRVSRLVLVAAAAYRQKLPPVVALARYPRLIRFLTWFLRPKFVVWAVLRSIVYDARSITSGQILAYARPLETWEGVRSAMAAAQHIMPADIDEVSARYSQIEVPTLLLWGDADYVIPLWVGERLAEEIPDSRLEVLDLCGHIPPEEHPAESLAVVENFLEQNPV